VIRKGRLIAVGHPDELRAKTGGPRVEFVGKGFGESVLAALRARPEVAGVEEQNGRLSVALRGDANAEVAPLVSLIVGAGAQVEEVRKGRASLEEAFLDLVVEEKR
jgi:ABC-2 type transport system ATP-binding protein